MGTKYYASRFSLLLFFISVAGLGIDLKLAWLGLPSVVGAFLLLFGMFSHYLDHGMSDDYRA
jgi:hypothetical protein